jgi:predicted flap endonuclease-1-like 5' DNA nuclease
MSAISCCWFWLLLGVLLGWLLNRLLCKCCCKKEQDVVSPISDDEINNLSNDVNVIQHENIVSAEYTSSPSSVVEPVIETYDPTTNVAETIMTVVDEIDLVAAKAAGFIIKNASDLTVIEGIGPKIDTLFKESGINSFAQFAAQTVPEMRAILDKGGSRFRIANPETWAQQAALAADNKWTELKQLQAELSGGVKK